MNIGNMARKTLFGLPLIVCLMLLSAIGGLVSGCAADKSAKADKIVLGVSTTIVNLRTGPGTDYEIVTGLLTTDTLKVLSDPEDENWLYVETFKGKDGFVSAKYVDFIGEAFASDYVVADAVPATGGDDKAESGLTPRAQKAETSLLAAYPLFITGSDAGAIVMLILFVVSIAVCVWMTKWYNYSIRCYHGEHSVAIAFAVVGVSMLFTLYEIAGIFSIRHGASAEDIVFAMMILSTGLPMAIIPWYIRLSGRYSLYDHSESDRVVWGERIGFIGWTILLVPLCIFYIQGAANMDLSTGDGSFGGMLINLAIYAVAGFIFCKYIWCYLIVKYLFKSMNSVILGLLNVVLVVGIGRYAYEMFYDSYNGLTFIVSAWAWFIITCYLLTVPITTVNEKRCANCHNFSGQQTGSTDLGSTYSSSTKWEDAGTSDISRRHAGSEISNSRRKVRVTTRTDKWRTHHQCPYCSKEWDIDHSDSREVGRETLERRWTETY